MSIYLAAANKLVKKESRVSLRYGLDLDIINNTDSKINQNSVDSSSESKSPVFKVNQIMDRVKKRQNTSFMLANHLHKVNQNKRRTFVADKIEPSNSSDDDFSLKKSNINNVDRSKRYSQLAGIVSDKELEDMRQKIDSTYKGKGDLL